MLRLFLTLLMLALPLPLLAQEAPKTVLVLDGSGSMWGQVDGVNKIVIARDVIGDLLTSLPADMELGLMSYGHRRKGDCSDIEMLAQPGASRAAIAAAVNAINPKGKTPLSAAVLQAAEALKYTEAPATVILVSDGIETCNMDPCAVGRQLESSGVDFTAHVIGFDVADPAALAQLQCLADETGGSFRTAANAEDLANALAVVVTAPPPDPARVQFQAREGADGPVIRQGIVWSITTEADGVLVGESADSPEPELSLLPGSGHAEVRRLADAASVEADFTVGDTPQTVTLVLPPYLPPASVSGPAEAAAGDTISIGWTGPDGLHDYVSVTEPDANEGAMTAKTYTETGNPVALRLPMQPGDYEIRYVLNDGASVLARQPIHLTEVAARLEAPASLDAGRELSVGWTGPNYDRDYIAIVPRGEDEHARLSYAYSGNGNPARFQAPAAPGEYDLLYVANDNGVKVLVRQPITLTPVSATLTAPEQVAAGSKVEVGFTGPANYRDLISFAHPDDPARRHDASAYPRHGNPLTIKAPKEPGIWELRYLLGGNDGTIIARQTVTVTETETGD